MLPIDWCQYILHIYIPNRRSECIMQITNIHFNRCIIISSSYMRIFKEDYKDRFIFIEWILVIIKLFWIESYCVHCAYIFKIIDQNIYKTIKEVNALETSISIYLGVGNFDTHKHAVQRQKWINKNKLVIKIQFCFVISFERRNQAINKILFKIYRTKLHTILISCQLFV